MSKGKFIVIYGINNLGKTTQIERLREFLMKEKSLSVVSLKYPIYDLEPTGPLITQYLRGENPYRITPREAQILYAWNRSSFQLELERILSSGMWVVAEDYVGTGLCWGLGADIEKSFLLKINEDLLKEDLAILFDGERFVKGIELKHKHENNNKLTEKVRNIHLELAKEFDWFAINANQIEEDVFKDLCFVVKQKLF